MPIVNVKGVANPMQFPDEMPINDIRAFLQNKFAQRAIDGQSDILAPVENIAAPYSPTLVEKIGGGIADTLKSTGLISDNYGAQQIGKNIASIGEFLPGIGDATAGDDFGRAVAEGDKFGMAMAGIGAVPIAGDALKGGARKVFHGSDRQIDNYLRGTNTKGRLGAGIYFGDKKKANVFAKLAKIKKQPSFLNEAEIVSDNPKKVTEDMLLHYPQGKFPSEIFEEKGYTGIQLIDENSGRIIEETVFDPKNIKSLNQSLPIDELGEFTKFSDKVAARRSAKLSVFDLPTKGKPENISDITDLFDYTPEQLVNQMKTLDNVGIRQGGYFKKGDGLNTFYKNDGTSQLIDPKTNKVIFENTQEQTENLIKDDILSTAQSIKTPEQRSAEFQARKANDAINNAREAALQDSYKMQHTAPMRGDNPSGDDLTDTFGSDIYTGNALQYFGTGSSYDSKAINIIQGMRGKPNKPVTIYRAVPKDVKSINSTDWVTTTKEYAQDHMEGEKGWHILSKKVKAKDIATDGNSIHEFGYDPTN